MSHPFASPRAALLGLLLTAASVALFAQQPVAPEQKPVAPAPAPEPKQTTTLPEPTKPKEATPASAPTTPPTPSGPVQATPSTQVAPTPAAPEIVWSPVRASVPATPEDELVIAAVGDIMLGSTFPEKDGSALPPQDGLHLLDEVAPFLKSADLSIGNLEGPLLDGTDPSPKCKGKAEGTCYAFRVPTRYAKLLADAGFVAMGVANNHAKDFGPAGQESTIATITAAGIAQSGGNGVVAHLLVKGKKVSYIAFATYPQFNNALDIDASTALVQAEAKLADYVIVSFHGGAEGSDRQHVPMGHEMFLGEDRGDLRTFTHAMIDAGAALVFGHGPHVVRGMEIYKGHLIAYSLGNFATYGHINLKGVNGLTLVLSARLGKDGRFLGGTVHPAYQEYPGGPHVDPEGKVLNVIRTLSQSDFGKTAVTVADDGAIVAPAAPTPATREASAAVGTSGSAPAPTAGTGAAKPTAETN